MAKVKISPEEPESSKGTIPPMPGGDAPGDSPSPSTFSGPETEDLAVVDEGLAGDLIALPFEAWAIFETRIPREQIVLSEKVKAFLAGPVSRTMTKYGLGKIARDEVIILVTLSVHTAGIFTEISKAKRTAVKIEPPEQS